MLHFDYKYDRLSIQITGNEKICGMYLRHVCLSFLLNRVYTLHFFTLTLFSFTYLIYFIIAFYCMMM